jgi:hypothetical protein
MNFPPSNADGNGGAILTLVRLLVSEKTNASDAGVEEDVYYSDWAPKKAKSPRPLRRSTPVVSGPPSVIFVQRDGEPLQRSQWTGLPFTLFSATFLLYAVPTTLEFFASQHFSPWISTILLGDIAGCLWLATVSRMRLLGLLLYIFLTASETGLYAFNLVDAGSMPWLTDLVPALFVAGIMSTRSKRCYS